MLNQKLIEIGNRISKKRKQLNLTQEVLAEKMNVSVAALKSTIDEELGKIPQIYGEGIWSILNVSTDYILKGELIDSDKEEAFTKLLKLNKQDYKMIEMLIDFCINKENDGSE